MSEAGLPVLITGKLHCSVVSHVHVKQFVIVVSRIRCTGTCKFERNLRSLEFVLIPASA